MTKFSFIQCLKMFLWLTCLTGIIYPFFITTIALLFSTEKSKGSFVYSSEKMIGSELIGQKFVSDKYFWSRPSAVDYNPIPSGATNLGPTSKKLADDVSKRRQNLLTSHGLPDDASIPSDLLFASGSGLDPHISVEAAFFQIDRVIKARALDPEQGRRTLSALIERLIEERSFGFLGEKRVNVLLLNK